MHIEITSTINVIQSQPLKHRERISTSDFQKKKKGILKFFGDGILIKDELFDKSFFLIDEESTNYVETRPVIT